MGKLNIKKLKRLGIFLVWEAIQIVLLLFLLGYTQALAMSVVMVYFPQVAHKGTFGGFISEFCAVVTCGVIAWILLMKLDKYKEMLFGD